MLHDPETGVAVVVPPGAIRRGRTQEIYFNVCQDSSLLPPLDARKGEAGFTQVRPQRGRSGAVWILGHCLAYPARQVHGGLRGFPGW